MTNIYSCLKKQEFQSGGFSIVPLRDEDKYDIMKWRNEQLFHLRQSKPLTKEDQDNYFKNTVAKLFDQKQPAQILFSYLKGDTCIGYGGLVHINWIDKNAEISFIINTSLEAEFFEFHWINYLGLIEQVGFKELNLHKIFTYAFDVRPNIYPILEKAGYKEEARLREHCLFAEKYLDVIIHSKFNRELTYRRASEEDMLMYFDWANDEEVRRQSFQTGAILLENHEKWFYKKIADPDCIMLVFENDNQEPVGQIRMEKQKNEEGFSIGISIAQHARNKGYATKMFIAASDYFFSLFPAEKIIAYIRAENISSTRSIEKAGFLFLQHIEVEGVPCVLYKKSKTDENSQY